MMLPVAPVNVKSTSEDGSAMVSRADRAYIGDGAGSQRVAELIGEFKADTR